MPLQIYSTLYIETLRIIKAFRFFHLNYFYYIFLFLVKIIPIINKNLFINHVLFYSKQKQI